MPVKNPWSYLLAAAAVATVCLAALGNGGRAGTRGGPPAGLFSAMEDMQTMELAIKKDANDPAKIEQTLRTLAQFERDVAIAKMARPPLDRVPDAEKGQVDYRKFMTTLQRTALDLEDAAIANKTDDIKKLIATLDQLEQAGHDEFR